MNFENIQMAVVRRRKDGIKVNISQINDDNRNDNYECIVCGSDVISAVPNGKTVDGKDAKVTPYFRHVNKDKCNSESWVHFWTKTEFIKNGDKFRVITDKENEYICNQIFFEKPIVIGDRKYIPDVTIHTSCGKIVHFEINYSNSKKIKDYIERWKELNNVIVEADINTMLCAFTDTIPTFKALYYEDKFFNLNDDDALYYNTIGKYKVTKEDEELLLLRKIEIEKLDWLWDEIRKIKHENKGFEDIGKLFQSISSNESKEIAINILKKTKCNNLLQNYVLFIKGKIDKRLKLLNLKYNGYLIKYDTEIPRLIYDRVFKGIIIKLYIPDNDDPEIFQTNNYNFTDKILNSQLKRKIDYAIKDISFGNDLLLHIIKVLEINNKIIKYKVHYKENTDYIDAIHFIDYRNKNYIIYKDNNEYYYSENNNNEEIKAVCKSVFIELINDETIFINLKYIYNLNNFVIETKDSYNFRDISTKYKPVNLFKQDNIYLSFRYTDKTFKYLSRFNFIDKMKDLQGIYNNIINYKSNYLNTDDYDKVFIEDGDDKCIRYISNDEIDNEIRKTLYPITCFSDDILEKYNITEDLNIRLNKEFTIDIKGRTQGWLLKGFTELLANLGIDNVYNIE